MPVESNLWGLNLGRSRSLGRWFDFVGVKGFGVMVVVLGCGRTGVGYPSKNPGVGLVVILVSKEP